MYHLQYKKKISQKVDVCTDEWSGNRGAWKAVTLTMLEEGKELPTNFVLDYARYGFS